MLKPAIYLILVFLIGAWVLGIPDPGYSKVWASNSFSAILRADSPEVDSVVRNYPFSVLHMTFSSTQLPPFDVTLVRPTKDTLQISPTGAADDSDSNGLDDAAIIGPYLYLNGMSKYGPVSAWVLYSHPVWGVLYSQGKLEETVNTTTGILDAPPYTPTGSVDGYLYLYIGLKIENLHWLGENLYYTKFPVLVQGNFNHSHPQAGDTYFNQNSSQSS